MYKVYRDMGDEYHSEFIVSTMDEVELMKKHLSDYMGYEKIEPLSPRAIIEIIADYIIAHKNSKEFYDKFCAHCDLDFEYCLDCPNKEE